MTFGSILYTLFIMPLQLFFEVIYTMANKVIDNPGISIIALSLAMNFLVLPLYRKADKMQEDERDIENKLAPGISHIKKYFKGDERMMMLQTFYRQNNYKPTHVFKGSISLFLEIPFFIAAYQFLSKLELLKGTSFYIINDLGAPDKLISLLGLNINVLPILMTLINVISCIIFTKGYPIKTKIQLYGMAAFFLVFLYNSPSGLVFYWTLNNLFSLVKTIFYKLKNPKKVLLVLFMLAGALVLVYGLFFYHTTSTLRKIFVIGVGAILIIPFFISLVFKNREDKREYNPSKKKFVLEALYLSVLLGLLIPSSVIKSSPQEFCNATNFLNPIWYIVSSSLYAFGLFIIWMSVFYWLSSKKARVYFEEVMFILCGVFTLDYMLFGKDLGILSNALVFEDGLLFSRREELINLLAIFVSSLLLFLLFKLLKDKVTFLTSVLTLALVIMVGINVVQINGEISSLKAHGDFNDETLPSFSLSKEGKNVVFIMLDRSMNEYIPYILNEKPELIEVYSGFTYYDNVLSFGGHTNFAAPALFGGYEYTPEAMNERSNTLLVDKHNEALKVLPSLFNDRGYLVTVCDAPYANYEWIPDLSIYDEYENIKTYHTKGKFLDGEGVLKLIKSNKRNFFCYSTMKVMPLIIQDLFYDHGRYNAPDTESNQTILSNYMAEGSNSEFENTYSVLTNFINMTEIKEGSFNTFMMIDNDTTHDTALLSVPEYEPNVLVDNTIFEEDNKDRFTVNGITLNMDDERDYAGYQCNMAALLRLGEWIEYLKDNGVYDNTRIVIASDHGSPEKQLSSMQLPYGDDVIYDVEYYYPLLLVKDFNEIEFKVSSEFMTNADVPSILLSGLIENPINPFTGNVIDMSKKNREQLVLASENWSVYVNDGTQFEPGIWLSVRDDVRDINNWKIAKENSR